MKIPTYLPQFDTRHTLIVLAGNRISQVYYAFNGTIALVAEVRVLDPLKDIDKLTAPLRSIAERYASEDVFLFAPRNLRKPLRRQLPQPVKRQLRSSLNGDYTGYQQVLLTLQKINEVQRNPFVKFTY